ncbi:MAG TPA: YIP1 family protein [Terracidiphilus sp.]|nr:YIP1 family protein [Terracidiphilus sp.]
MSDMQTQPAATTPEQGAGLSQLQRVVNTFGAPSKTFTDIRDHSRSWWLPFVIYAVLGYVFFAAVSMKIGMSQVVQNQIQLDAKAQERMANATPEQREMSNKIAVGITEGVFIANPLLLLAGIAVLSLGLWGTINFVFGGKAKYGHIFTVWMFAGLPGIVKPILGSVLIMMGVAPDTFNIKNYAPTNLAALFMNPVESNKALYSLASSLDVVTIWMMVLLGMGTAIVAGVKRGSGYIAVFGWWAIFVLIGVGWTAAFS